MSIKWEISYTDRIPYSAPVYIYGDIKRMLSNIAWNKRCYIIVSRYKNMTLDIVMRYGEDSLAINYVPKGAEKFKYIKNAWENRLGIEGKYTRYFFLITNKQKLEQLKEYISLALEEMNLGIDEIDVFMDIRGIEELKE